MYEVKSHHEHGYIVVTKEMGYFVARFDEKFEAEDHVDFLTAADRVVDHIHRDLSTAALEIGDRNKLAAYVASQITQRDKSWAYYK